MASTTNDMTTSGFLPYHSINSSLLELARLAASRAIPSFKQRHSRLHVNGKGDFQADKRPLHPSRLSFSIFNYPF